MDFKLGEKVECICGCGQSGEIIKLVDEREIIIELDGGGFIPCEPRFLKRTFDLPKLKWGIYE